MVAERLNEVRRRMAAAAEESGRDPGRVSLVVVTKGRSQAEVMEAYDAGHREFGESRAQELAAKAPGLPADIWWHFVGPLQRNKVRLVRPAVVLLHSMDRLALAQRWLKGPGAAPPALLQVNVGGEEQKIGVAPDEAEATAERMLEMGVDLRGVMTIPPRVADPEESRPYFARLEAIRRVMERRWPELTEVSAGMTDDFEVAVAEGATIVRVGRAIFGPASERPDIDNGPR